jgi:hypothetical protein
MLCAVWFCTLHTEAGYRHCERSEAIHAGTLDCFTAFAMTEGLTAIVFVGNCEARSKDGEGRNDDEKQCTKLLRAKYNISHKAAKLFSL